MTIPTISALSEAPRNNFTPMRVVAALTVLISHSWPLLQFSNDNEPLYRWIHVSMGALAVGMFFGISGFLVSASWERRPRAFDFLASRFLRIFPGLLMVLLITVFVLGPIVTTRTVRDYFSDPLTWTYVPRSLALFARQDVLPGVFQGHVYEVVNASLWSLAYEMCCYLSMLTLGIYGMLRPSRFAPMLIGLAVFSLVVVGIWPSMDHRVSRLFDVCPSFLAGMALWIWRRQIRLNGPWILLSGLGLALAMHFRVPANTVLFAVWVAVASIWLAYVQPPAWLARILDAVPDGSYGIYIYAFPIQQTVILMKPDITVAQLTWLAIGPTLLFAFCSWTLIERPALSLRKRLVGKSAPTAVQG